MPASRVKKIVVLRQGALGDVLVVRAAICFLRSAFPEAAVNLVAPGEKGRLFLRDGWADAVFNWESADFSWLFSDGDSEAPSRVKEVFNNADLVVSYVDAAHSLFSVRLRSLAKEAACFLSPSRPSSDEVMRIDKWLVRNIVDFCFREGILSSSFTHDMGKYISARIPFEVATDQEVLVIHPGSGSGTKNWPIRHFVRLAQLLLHKKCGVRPLCKLVVTSGEADGDLGERVCAGVPSATLWRGELAELAELLAGCGMYIGNDSGVSHLASSVCGVGGSRPRIAVIFGPSDPRIWLPEGALLLEAGARMDALDPETAFMHIKTMFSTEKA